MTDELRLSPTGSDEVKIGGQCDSERLLVSAGENLDADRKRKGPISKKAFAEGEGLAMTRTNRRTAFAEEGLAMKRTNQRTAFAEEERTNQSQRTAFGEEEGLANLDADRKRRKLPTNFKRHRSHRCHNLRTHLTKKESCGLRHVCVCLSGCL